MRSDGSYKTATSFQMPDIRTSEKQIIKWTKRKREGEEHKLPQKVPKK